MVQALGPSKYLVLREVQNDFGLVFLCIFWTVPKRFVPVQKDFGPIEGQCFIETRFQGSCVKYIN